METMSPEGGVRRRPEQPAGVYVHVPACARRCPYCDFGVETGSREVASDVIERVVRAEWPERKARLAGREVVSLYVGGGTPSRAEDAALGRLTERVTEQAAGAGLEISVEVNPEDLDARRAERWVKMGVDRVFVGAQSFRDEVLEALGRRHAVEDVERSLEGASSAGLSVGIDLMMGVPGQTEDDWAAELESLETRAEDIDVVCGWELGWDEGPPEEFREAALRRPSVEGRRAMLEALAERCEGLGFERREHAVFARPGVQREHTEGVWRGMEVLGLGPGARGLTITEEPGVGVERWQNARDLQEWAGDSAGSRSSWTVAPADYLVERVATGLRWAGGVEIDVLRHQFGESVGAARLDAVVEGLERLEGEGLAEFDDGRMRPTLDGMARSLAVWEAVDEVVEGVLTEEGGAP